MPLKINYCDVPGSEAAIKNVISNMARQCGDIIITGTIENLCFYKMEGKYYVRAKSSLKGKRVKTDPAFKKTMAYAGMLASASTIASAVYKQLDSEKKIKGLYRKMTGEVMQLLKSGATNEDALLQLALIYFKKEKDEKAAPKRISRQVAIDAIIEAIFSECFEVAALIPSAPP